MKVSKITKLFGMLVLAALIISACAPAAEVPVAEEPAAEVETAPETEAEPYEIAVVVKITGIPWFNRLEEGVLQAADDFGVNAYSKIKEGLSNMQDEELITAEAAIGPSTTTGLAVQALLWIQYMNLITVL